MMSIAIAVVIVLIFAALLTLSAKQTLTPQELKATYFAPGINETLDALLRQTDIASTQQAVGTRTPQSGGAIASCNDSPIHENRGFVGAGYILPWDKFSQTMRARYIAPLRGPLSHG